DEAGRVISRTKHPNQRHERHETFVWNGFNQLITFNDKAQHQWHYKYDGLGRRIEKYSERDNTTTKYIWDGDQLALTQTFKRDKLIHQRHSVFHGWELLAQQDSYQDKQTTHYAVSQPNGKILGLFTPEGELTWKAEKRTLWGICFDWYQFKYPNPLDPEMLFAGQWLDQESGLAYNRFRYYDPETGNYLCLDPIGLNGGETPYSYVHNPWDWVDLFGLAGCKPKISPEQFQAYKKLKDLGLSTKDAAKYSKGFDSFSQFKRVVGGAGKGNAWHHIVEQTPSNLTKFGANKIHNINNLIKLPHGKGTIHSQISGFYSSKAPFTQGKTVRKWISPQTFDEQFKFGVEQLKRLGWNF
ncbi:RHS repeat domain-containing protein, partial [Muribacter muris]